MEILLAIVAVTVSFFFLLWRSPTMRAKLFFWNCFASAAIGHYWSLFMQRITGVSFLDQVSDKRWIHQMVQKTMAEKTIPPTVEVKITNDPLRGGFIGSMIKLALNWSPKTDDSALPNSLVVKTVSQTFRHKLVSVILGNPREAYFYSHFYKCTTPDKQISVLPRVYHSSGSYFTGNFVIVMEDLSRNNILSSQLLGNQCWGPVQIPKSVEQDPLVIINTIFAEIATVHSMFWRDRNLLRHSWLKNVDWIQGNSRHTWEFCINTMSKKWSKVKTFLEQNTGTVKWSPKLVKTMDQVIQNTSWSNYQENFDIHSPNTPFTLCHGDFHAGNIMWSMTKAKPQITLLDWSEVGVFCPFTELAQFLVSNATIKLRRNNEKQLFKAYYDPLSISHSDFPLSDCWERYKAGGIEKWLQMLVILTCLSLDSNALPMSAIQWFHDQVSAFIDDHADSCKRPLMLMTGYGIP